MWHAKRMGILEIHETTPLCIVGISPLRSIRLIWDGYIKLHIKEIKRETATQDRVQRLALVNTVPQSQAISWPAESLSRFGQCSHTNAMLCDVWTAFLSTRSPRASRKLWSSCRGNGFHCTMKTDVIRYQQACSTVEFRWIMLRRHSETCGTNFILF